MMPRTVTVEVPDWIADQILSGQFTAVTAAAQLIEAAVLETRTTDQEETR